MPTGWPATTARSSTGTRSGSAARCRSGWSGRPGRRCTPSWRTPRSVRWTRWSRSCRTNRPPTATPSAVSAGDWTGLPPGSTRSGEGSSHRAPTREHREHRSMTDEQRPTDEDGEGTATPWWVSPPRDVWDARPPEPAQPAVHAEPTAPAEPAVPAEPAADENTTERYGAVY